MAFKSRAYDLMSAEASQIQILPFGEEISRMALLQQMLLRRARFSSFSEPPKFVVLPFIKLK